jgi:hypothetical protein
MARTGGRVISVPGPLSTRVAWQAHGPLHAGPLCGERRRGNQWEKMRTLGDQLPAYKWMWWGQSRRSH